MGEKENTKTSHNKINPKLMNIYVDLESKDIGTD